MAGTNNKQVSTEGLGLYQWIANDLQRLRNELLKEMRYSAVQVGSLYQEFKADNDASASAISQEIRYSYKQNQTIYDGLASMLTSEVGDRLNSVDEKLAALEQVQTLLDEVREVKYGYQQLQALYEGISDEVVNKLGALEELAKIEKALEEAKESINAFVVDYERIADDVGDKLVDVLNQLKGTEEVKIDYDRIIYGAAEKVVESLPVPEKVDYNRINDSINNAVASIAIPEIDYEKLAEVVAAKVVVPEIDYDKLADVVIAKMAAQTEQSYDVVLDDAGLAQVADKISEKIGSVLEEKLATEEEEETTYDLVIDEEGIKAIAQGVSEEICRACATCEIQTAEVVEEVPVAEPVVEEAVVEEVVEEPVEEAPVEEELAATEAPVEEHIDMEELNNQLIDAETGLVIRLKKSFTAKIRQSEEAVKGYYSDIKNELTSYKKINSSVSWHGDRFNYGRNTVAKINICGKTLCFYLALDPNDPEYKNTVYHQKDVGNQKAYESTPFMVKVKSDAAAKKALRLVGYLAEKLGTTKDEKFEPVDYVEEYGYQSTKKLFDDGFIKATKEKKVELDF